MKMRAKGREKEKEEGRKEMKNREKELIMHFCLYFYLTIFRVFIRNHFDFFWPQKMNGIMTFN